MATLMHRGFERAADRFGYRDAVGWETGGGRSATGRSRARPAGAGAPDTDDIILVFRSGHHGLP